MKRVVMSVSARHISIFDKRYRDEITPRYSLRCKIGVHNFMSYCMDPAKFECTRCGKKKDMN